MMDDSAPPELPELTPQPVPEPPPERIPFWGYHDLIIFIGLFIVSLIAGFAVVSGFLKVARVHPENDLFRALPAQFLAYLFVFLALWLMFRTQYDRPFWSSLNWTSLRLRSTAIISYG